MLFGRFLFLAEPNRTVCIAPFSTNTTTNNAAPGGNRDAQLKALDSKLAQVEKALLQIDQQQQHGHQNPLEALTWREQKLALIQKENLLRQERLRLLSPIASAAASKSATLSPPSIHVQRPSPLLPCAVSYDVFDLKSLGTLLRVSIDTSAAAAAIETSTAPLQSQQVFALSPSSSDSLISAHTSRVFSTMSWLLSMYHRA